MRITIDIDNKRELKKVILKINDFFNKKIIDEICQSSSKRGYHIIIYDLNITFDECMILRKIFGDDRRRLYIDSIRHRQGHATQVLFTSKSGKRIKKVFDRKRNINKLPPTVRYLV